jgi:HlyD family secretion protein
MQISSVPAASPIGRGPLGLPVSRFVFWAVIVAAGAVVVLGIYLVVVRPSAVTAPPVATVRVIRGPITAVVNSTGQVAPFTQAKLSFKTAGRVAALPVQVGQAVHKGDVLASLDTTDLEIQVEQAQANLASARAKLEAVQSGSRPEEIAAAQAQLDAEKAKLAAMLAGGRPEEVRAAEAALASAQAKLRELKGGSLPADLAAARAAVDQARAALASAQANLANLQRPPDPLAVQAASLAVAQARDALWSAQISRDGSCNPVNPRYLCDAANATVAADEAALQQAQVKLAQVQQPAKPEDVAAAKAAVASARAQLDSATARLKQLQAGPLPDEIAQAEAAVVQAQQSLDEKRHPYTQADIDQQRAAVAQAEAQLALKRSPYTRADLDAARAAVDQAQAQLDLARYNLEAATLRAPFDGIVSAVSVNVGEMVSPGAGTPVVSLVDPSNLHLDVSIDETDIAHVQVGQNAAVTFEALPGKTFQGRVAAIAPSAAVQQGVATYVVTILLQDAAGVRPGMTGDADIIYARKESALLVPNRAIRSDGNRRVVTVLEGGRLVTREVTVGIVGDQLSEILGGLKEGDAVVMPVTTAVLPPFAGGQR